jgi:hypothetical protein
VLVLINFTMFYIAPFDMCDTVLNATTLAVVLLDVLQWIPCLLPHLINLLPVVTALEFSQNV